VERKGSIVGVLALVALGAGLVFFLSRGNGDARGDGVARLDAQSGRVVSGTAGGSASEGEGSGGSVASREGPRVVGDGGVATRPVLPTPVGPIQANRTVPARADVPRSADAAQQSSGWRLGQTRRQLEVIQPRIAMLRRALADLEQRGDAAAIEQQRAVVQRFENRLTELREDQMRFEEEARRDGTLAEADRGYQDTMTTETARAPARAVAPGVAPQ
jgi:hypothetical protein